MKKTIILVAATVVQAFAVFADNTTEAPGARRVRMMRESQMRRFGGLVVRPDAYRGRILIANTGTPFDAEIKAVAGAFARNVRIRVETGASEKPTLETAGGLVAKSAAQAVLFVVNDKDIPNLLVAPENRWTVVNLARMADGTTDKAVVSRRVRSEIARGLAYLGGAADAAIPNTLMTSVTSPRGLDSVTEELPAAETFARMQNYLRGLGVTPLVEVPYQTACEEGWAPQPTNEYQRAIWDKARAVPANPIKIEFDPAKGR